MTLLVTLIYCYMMQRDGMEWHGVFSVDSLIEQWQWAKTQRFPVTLSWGRSCDAAGWLYG